MNQSCSHKIARLLAVLICCALLAGCKGKEQEDVFPDIAHYTVPEQNSMRVTLYFPTEEPSAFSSEVRQVDLPSGKRPSEAVWTEQNMYAGIREVIGWRFLCRAART